MIALLVVLFFGVTGITLNHPDWTFGDAVDTTTATGTLSASPTAPDGTVNWLPVAEEIRSQFGVKGTVSDFGASGTDAHISFVNPGYSADLFFDTATGTFELSVEQQGFVAVMNDLHKGRDTGSGWRWVIDLAAGFLILVSLTGLTMQLFLRKRRRSALITAAAGALLAVVAIWVTIR
ncbi:MAG: PepSY-associated TM helix domain-containing protein [Acidimicrobiales bacterium]